MQKTLVIHDDRDMCLSVRRFLNARGVTASHAVNGKQALELLDFTESQLGVCEFRLGNCDKKIMHLHIREIYPILPAIIVAGRTRIMISWELRKLGAYDHITKPILPDEIISTLKDAICRVRNGLIRQYRKLNNY